MNTNMTQKRQQILDGTYIYPSIPIYNDNQSPCVEECVLFKDKKEVNSQLLKNN